MTDERSIPRVAVRETCRVVSGRVPLWPYHHARLRAAGCGHGLLSVVDERVIAAAADWDAPRGSRVRLTVTVSPAGEVSVGVKQRLSSLDVPGGPVVARVDIPGPPPLPPVLAKPADREWWDEAQRVAASRDAHQAVIVGPEGMVVDGGTASVWIVEGEVIITPPAPPAVAGVARAFLIDEADERGLTAVVEPVSWERFEGASEAFLTNAFGGAVAVRDRGGLVFDQVASQFERLWRSA